MNAFAADIGSVEAARSRIRGYAVTTPVLTSANFDEHAGGRVFVKAENLQRTGSFKFRGAINRLLAMSKSEHGRGVVAFSSGNHALAVAEAARLLNCPAVLLMPTGAPTIKINGARSRGAEVVLYDPRRDDREVMVQRLALERGLILVPPFDDPFVIAGQGTGAAEAMEQISIEHGLTRIDQALICCSGGGLAAGWATALSSASPAAEIIVVEPVGFDDTARSLSSGKKEKHEQAGSTLCDALQVVAPGDLTLPILLARHARGVTVSDADVMRAMCFAASELKLVLEPGGAAAIAAVLASKVETKGRNTLVIASGGNVDLETFSKILTCEARQA